MTSILPDLGTVYSSLPAFKLDVFERGCESLSFLFFSGPTLTLCMSAVKSSRHLTTQSSSPDKHSHIHCAVKVGPEKKFCTFRVVAKNVAGVITVTDVTKFHSCRDQDTLKARSKAKKRMEKMVHKAKMELKEFERKGKVSGEATRDSEDDPTASRCKSIDNVEGEQEQDSDKLVSDNDTSFEFSDAAAGDQGDNEDDEDDEDEWEPEYASKLETEDEQDSDGKIDDSSEADSDFEPSSDDDSSRPTKRQKCPPSAKKLRRIYPSAGDLECEIDQLKKVRASRQLALGTASLLTGRL